MEPNSQLGGGVQEGGFFSRSFMKFAGLFLLVLALGGVSYFIWNRYFSPEARMQANVEKYENW